MSERRQGRAEQKRALGNSFGTYGRIIGLIVLVYVITLLLSPPSMILAKSVALIDTELSYASSEAILVRAKLDFGNNEHMRAFPTTINGWVGSDYDETRVAEQLGADVLLMRDYVNPETFQPVVFLVLQSNNRTSFHPPIVCYPALGYTIEEEGKAAIPVRNLSWVEAPWFVPSRETLPECVLFPVKKLVVVKQSDGKVTERLVVLYFYVKDGPVSSNTVTMVRVSALAPTEGAYDGILNLTTEFMGNTLPCMFELRSEDTIFTLLRGSLAGNLAIGVLLCFPLFIIFYPELRAKCSRDRRG
jgi:hypothetical protein